ncbi:MAG: phosphate/phosphonate ABC transporter permease [Burkholderiales bacterium]|nr:phosphate/phosphonate ABC transporter permease [Burkholderiales bacterium]
MLGKQELQAPFQLHQTSRKEFVKNLVWGVLLALLAVSWQGADMRPLELLTDGAEKLKYAASFFPPDFHLWSNYLDELIETFQMALWGTALGTLFAIPLGLLMASNVTPWWINRPVRGLMDAAGAINEVVLAMLFVVAVGLGPFAGVLALFVATAGVLSTLFAESLQTMDPKKVLFVSNVLPHVAQQWTSLIFERLRSNFRMATVVGLVGAGGIGVTLWEIIREYRFDRTCAVLVMTVLAVALVDFLTVRARKILLN